MARRVSDYRIRRIADRCNEEDGLDSRARGDRFYRNRRSADRGNEKVDRDPGIIYDYPPAYDEYEDEEWYYWMTGAGVTYDPTGKKKHKGPEVRSGDVPKPILLHEGQKFNFTIKRGVSTNDTVSVNYDDFINGVEAGDTLLVDGGRMSLAVKSKAKDLVTCEVIDGATTKFDGQIRGI